MDARGGLARRLAGAPALRGPAAALAGDHRPLAAGRPTASPLGSAGVRDLPEALPVSPRPPSTGNSGMASAGSLATGMSLKPAPYSPGDVRFPINLATVLRLSDARPLIVAAAQASVWVAEAELTRAKVLWVPTLNLGFDYIRHDGGGPDFNKGIMTAPSVNFFYGGGGMWGNLPMADAVFEPLAARQVLNSRHWDVQSAKNDALMRTAEAYFRVHHYRGHYAGAIYCVERGARACGTSRVAERRAGPQGRGGASPKHAGRPRAEGRFGARGVASQER